MKFIRGAYLAFFYQSSAGEYALPKKTCFASFKLRLVVTTQAGTVMGQRLPSGWASAPKRLAQLLAAGALFLLDTLLSLDVAVASDYLLLLQGSELFLRHPQHITEYIVVVLPHTTRCLSN